MPKRNRGITGNAARKRNAIRVHEKRMAENEEQRKNRLSAMASRLREKRAAETEEERNWRLSTMAERARYQRAKKARKQRNSQLKKMGNDSIGCCSQDVTGCESMPSRRKKALQLSIKHQKFFYSSRKVTTANCVPVIKTEIFDPSEQNQDFIVSGYPQHASTIDPKCLVKTHIQDSSKTNQLPLPNIKVEPTEIENDLSKPIKTEKFSESFRNSEIESSPTCKYKMTHCFVLLGVMHLPHS